MRGKSGAVDPAGFRIDRTGARGPVAGAQHVDADDEIVFERKNRAGGENLGPPGAHQRRAGKCMAHQHGVIAGGVEPPVNRVMQCHSGTACAHSPATGAHQAQSRLRKWAPEPLTRADGASVPEAGVPGFIHHTHCAVMTPAHRCAAARAGERMAVGGFDRLVEIGDDVADVLDAHREPHHFRRHAGGGLLLRRQLLVRGRGGVDHQRLGVADVRQQAEQLQRVDELLARLVAALDAERDAARPGRWADISWRARNTGSIPGPG